MDLKRMTREQLEKLLIENVEEEVIEHSIQSLDPSPSIQFVADFIHTLLCRGDHSSGECGYYAEMTLEGMWQRSAHMKWLAMVRGWQSKHRLDDEEFRHVIEDCAALLQEVKSDKVKLDLLSEIFPRVLSKLIQPREEPGTHSTTPNLVEVGGTSEKVLLPESVQSLIALEES